MNSKFTLALIALIGVGVFALPSTMALFAGQHTFYNIDATGNQVPCQKCHGDVKVELSGATAMAGSQAPHATFQCEYCHRTEAGYAAGDDAYVAIRYGLVNASLTRIYLITTMANYENGNFPKQIEYTSTLTVDNWNGSVYQWDGIAAFVDKTELRENNLYAGTLSVNTTAGSAGRYIYQRGSPTRLRNSDGTLPTGMTNNPFDARIVNVSSTGTVNLTGNGANAITPGTTYHAASLVSCMECHGGEQMKGAPGYEISTSTPYNHRAFVASSCSACHYGGDEAKGAMAAGGFADASGIGLTTGNASEGKSEAHNEFVYSDSQGILRNASDGYGASNIACVACHTHVAVDINFQKKYKVKLDAYGTGTGNWNVGGYAAEGTVMISEYGNSDGSVFGVSNKTYNWDAPTGGSTLYVGGNATTPILGLNNDTSDNQAALTS